MGTCERCGADAVDAAGRCGNCGWQAAAEAPEQPMPAASLGQTRAVEAPEQPLPPSRGGPGSYPPFDATVDLPRASGDAHPPARTTRVPPTAAGTPAARYCGACGARITGNEAFCGQCGTPIGQTTGEYDAPYGGDMGAPSRYHVGVSGPWGGARPDDLTEAYMPAPMVGAQQGFGRAGVGPYSGPSYRPAGPAPTGDVAAARRTRIVVGLLCIAGGLASAAGAIIVAVAK